MVFISKHLTLGPRGFQLLHSLRYQSEPLEDESLEETEEEAERRFFCFRRASRARSSSLKRSVNFRRASSLRFSFNADSLSGDLRLSASDLDRESRRLPALRSRERLLSLEPERFLSFEPERFLSLERERFLSLEPDRFFEPERRRRFLSSEDDLRRFRLSSRPLRLSTEREALRCLLERSRDLARRSFERSSLPRRSLEADRERECLRVVLNLSRDRLEVAFFSAFPDFLSSVCSREGDRFESGRGEVLSAVEVTGSALSALSAVSFVSPGERFRFAVFSRDADREAGRFFASPSFAVDFLFSSDVREIVRLRRRTFSFERERDLALPSNSSCFFSRSLARRTASNSRRRVSGEGEWARWGGLD